MLNPGPLMTEKGHFVAPPKPRGVLFVTALNSSVSRIGRKSCLDLDLSWSLQLL